MGWRTELPWQAIVQWVLRLHVAASVQGDLRFPVLISAPRSALWSVIRPGMKLGCPVAVRLLAAQAARRHACLLLLRAQGKLRGRTFTAPRKSMKGKGRITVQFGCCYNYAEDRQGRPPGERAASCAVPPTVALCHGCMHAA